MGSRVRLALSLSLLAIGVLPLSAHSYPLVHDWSHGFGSGISFSAGNGVAIDDAGNVVIAGFLTGTVDFGAGPHTSAGSYDVYVAKFDALGNCLWSRIYGGGGVQQAMNVAIDKSDGSILVTGTFEGSVDFGGGPLVSVNSYDIFLSKLDAYGTHKWSRSFGGIGFDVANGLAVDVDGNVGITGSFRGKLNFGDGQMESAGNEDVYVAVFDSDGNVRWSDRYGDAGIQIGNSLAMDTAGNVLATGMFRGSLDFGGGPLANIGQNDIFVVKFDRDGIHQWSRAFGNALDQNGRAIAADSYGNVLVAGDFDGAVDFGGGIINSGGYFDGFVAKFDPSGAHLWSHGFGDASNQSANGLAVDNADNVAVTGNFDGTMALGGDPLVCTGVSDVFVAQFDPAGSHIWSDNYGDADSQIGAACAADPVGSIVVTGYFYSTIDFGGGVLTGGAQSVFLAKFSTPAPHIQSIVDVPGDQGGSARMVFTPSLVDKIGISQDPVINYHVFRRIDDAALVARVSSEGVEAGASLDYPATLGGAPVISLDGRAFWRAPAPVEIDTRASSSAFASTFNLWEAVATVPARQEPFYIGLIPTLADSGAVVQQTVYFVMAQTTTPWVYYDSAPDSGYSVDNLSPATPLGLAGTPAVSPAALTLGWNANEEHDLSHYAVYRGTAAGFVPGASNRLAVPSSPVFVDHDWRWNSGYYYKVAALDVHNNESGYALLTPTQITGIGDDGPPAANFLSQNQPNPFSSTTLIAFGLQNAADVRIRIYDVAGRLVRDLASGHYAADQHVVSWDGRDGSGRAVAGGVYFYRIDAGTFVQTRKLLLLR